MCDPATREVRQINPIIAPDGGFHQMDTYKDTRLFYVTPLNYTLTAAINACRLQRARRGGCIGFAVEPATDTRGNKVTLLYNAGPQTKRYRSDLLDETPQVYSIEACL